MLSARARRSFVFSAFSILVLALVASLASRLDGGEPSPFRTIERRANWIVWSSLSERLYATIPSSEGAPHGNHLVIINPESGEIEDAVFAGSEPDRLAISHDGSKIYIALDGNNRVVPFDVQTATAGDAFRIGESDDRVEDMVVVPGSPNAIVVSKNPGPGSSRNRGLVVFVDGEALPDTARPPINAITFSDDPTVLYGHNSAFSPHTSLLDLRVDLSPDGGVTFVRETNDVFGAFQDDIIFDGGRVYCNRGDVIDPIHHEPFGEFDLPFGTPKFIPESETGRTYYLLEDGISAYDQRTFLHADTFDFPELAGGRRLPDGRRGIARWGDHGLAFLTNETIHIFESEIVPERVIVEPTRMSRGDFNGDSDLDLSDAVSILNFLFQGSFEPRCINAGDVDDDGDLLITDAVFLLAHLFQGGDAIPPPAAPSCGEDPTENALDCASGSACD